MWISKKRYEELVEKEKQFADSMVNKAMVADKVLNTLNVKAESANQIREALAMEILAEKFEMQDKYSKATFVRTQGVDVMTSVREMLVNEGVLTRKIEVKKK